MNASVEPIRVLVADDSAFMRMALCRMIASEPGLAVVGTAFDGEDAISKAATLSPDVITLDIQMPRLNGLEALRRIMAEKPLPVIIVSSVAERDAEATLTALANGAFECIAKSTGPDSLDIDHLRDQLVGTIRAAAAAAQRAVLTGSLRKPVQAAEEFITSQMAPSLIAIGTSTGGPKALENILPQLPADLGIPVMIVQHMPAGFTSPFAHRLDKICNLRVHEAAHDEEVVGGLIYLAPAGKHMTVRRAANGKARAILSPEPNGHMHVPSVDVLMFSVAEEYGSRALGIIMTGMGSDGAQGMKAIYDKGGLTIGQDEATSAVYGMPRACAMAGCLKQVLPLDEIPRQIIEVTRYRKRA